MKNLLAKLMLVYVFLSLSVVAQAEGFNAEEKYKSTCNVCHGSGVAGAPRKGDSNAWATRLAQGEEAMLNSVKNGKGAMPAKGLCTDCTDEQFKALINYLSH